MDENPYQSPSTPPASNVARRNVTLTVLSILAVPAAAIAGGASCVGVAIQLDDIMPVAIPAGAVVSLAVLYGSHYYLANQKFGRSRKASHGWAIAGVLIATPFAVAIAAAIFVGGYNISGGGGDSFNYYYIAGSIAAFSLWSLGFWAGLRRWGFQNHEPTKTRASEPK